MAARGAARLKSVYRPQANPHSNLQEQYRESHMKIPESKFRGAALGLGLRCAIGPIFVAASAHAQSVSTTAQSYSGRATVGSANLLRLPAVEISDTGPPPDTGRPFQ